jgi:hypothetical protein
MENTTKLTKLLSTCRHEREACDWVFSLIPISVAFVFYVLFIMSANLEHSGVFIAYGAAAGFIGLETYWVVRGWKKNNLSTIILSVIAIIMTVVLLRIFLQFM